MDTAFVHCSIGLPWQSGDIAIPENIAWAHARALFQLKPGEKRVIGILVSEPIPRRRLDYAGS